VRMEDAWAHGVQFAIAGVCFLLLFALAFAGGLGEDDRPSAAQSTLLVSGLVLLYGVVALALRARWRRHGAQMVNASMIALLALLEATSALIVVEGIGGRPSAALLGRRGGHSGGLGREPRGLAADLVGSRNARAHRRPGSAAPHIDSCA
jgi:hypothetical protein